LGKSTAAKQPRPSIFDLAMNNRALALTSARAAYEVPKLTMK